MRNQLQEVWYRGHVQGVGFRYTVAGIARRHPVTGYVNNLPDGRVHLVCEGTPEALGLFLAEITDRLQPFIRGKEQGGRPATGQFSRFEIRH